MINKGCIRGLDGLAPPTLPNAVKIEKHCHMAYCEAESRLCIQGLATQNVVCGTAASALTESRLVRNAHLRACWIRFCILTRWGDWHTYACLRSTCIRHLASSWHTVGARQGRRWFCDYYSRKCRSWAHRWRACLEREVLTAVLWSTG